MRSDFGGPCGWKSNEGKKRRSKPCATCLPPPPSLPLQSLSLCPDGISRSFLCRGSGGSGAGLFDPTVEQEENLESESAEVEQTHFRYVTECVLRVAHVTMTLSPDPPTPKHPLSHTQPTSPHLASLFFQRTQTDRPVFYVFVFTGFTSHVDKHVKLNNENKHINTGRQLFP